MRCVGGNMGGIPSLLLPFAYPMPLSPHPPTHPQIQAQLDKLATRKEEVSEKWDRHWEWLQQSEWGPGHGGPRATGGVPQHGCPRAEGDK